MITGKINEPVKVRDYSDQNFTPDDEKDFEVKTLREERLIDTIPELDELLSRTCTTSAMPTTCRTATVHSTAKPAVSTGACASAKIPNPKLSSTDHRNFFVAK